MTKKSCCGSIKDQNLGRNNRRKDRAVQEFNTETDRADYIRHSHVNECTTAIMTAVTMITANEVTTLGANRESLQLTVRAMRWQVQQHSEVETQNARIFGEACENLGFSTTFVKPKHWQKKKKREKEPDLPISNYRYQHLRKGLEVADTQVCVCVYFLCTYIVHCLAMYEFGEKKIQPRKQKNSEVHHTS